MHKIDAMKTGNLLGVVATGLLLTAVNSGCSFTNQNHCALNQGACEGGLVCSMCASENNGCVPEPEAQCRFDTDSGTNTTDPTTDTTMPTTLTDPTTITEDPTTITEDPTETTTESETTTETETTTDTGFMCNADSPDDGTCTQPDAPYCVDGMSCGNCEALGDCSKVSADTPACHTATGLCVECLPGQLDACKTSAPVCNPYTNECSTCFEHGQCASGACNFVSNQCFEGNTIWVEKRVDCSQEDGTEEHPYCELADAIAAEAVVAQPIIFRVKYNELQPHQEQVVISGSYRIAIIGNQENPDEYPEVSSAEAQPRFDVKAGAWVFVHRMKFNQSQNANPAAITCQSSGTRLYLDQVIIRENEDPVEIGENCIAEIRRSDVSDNANGLVNNLGELKVINSFVTHNHNQNFSNKNPALTAIGSGVTTVLYSMLYDSPGINASAISCPGGASVLIRNSVVLGNEMLPVDFNCEETVSTSWMDVAPETIGDILVRVSPNYGAYAAQEGAVELEVGQWMDGDPFIDYNGAVRPIMDGAPDIAGADLP